MNVNPRSIGGLRRRRAAAIALTVGAAAALAAPATFAGGASVDVLVVGKTRVLE